jgi:hypothetical protein
VKFQLSVEFLGSDMMSSDDIAHVIGQAHRWAKAGKATPTEHLYLTGSDGRVVGYAAVRKIGRLPLDLTGLVFGRLQVLARANIPRKVARRAHKAAYWLCRCQCGTASHIVRGDGLRTGKTRSCGCLRREVSSRFGGTHIPKPTAEPHFEDGPDPGDGRTRFAPATLQRFI